MASIWQWRIDVPASLFLAPLATSGWSTASGQGGCGAYRAGQTNRRGFQVGGRQRSDENVAQDHGCHETSFPRRWTRRGKAACQRPPQQTGEELRQVSRVIRRLTGHAGKRCAGPFRFDHTDGAAIDEQQVVARTALEGTSRKAMPRQQRDELSVILHDPACCGEQPIYLLPAFSSGAMTRGVASFVAAETFLRNVGF